MIFIFTEKAMKEGFIVVYPEGTGLFAGRLWTWNACHCCPAGKDVVFYLVKDKGHAWSGGNPGSRRGDKPVSLISATNMIWEFFQSQKR